MYAVKLALRTWLKQHRHNEYANDDLLFLAEFLLSYCTEDNDDNALFNDTFNYVVGLENIEKHFRCRICHFLNSLLTGRKAVDEDLCKKLEEKMLKWIERDNVAFVRAEVIKSYSCIWLSELYLNVPEQLFYVLIYFRLPFSVDFFKIYFI
jgi:hypothetical protein